MTRSSIPPAAHVLKLSAEDAQLARAMTTEQHNDLQHDWRERMAAILKRPAVHPKSEKRQ